MTKISLLPLALGLGLFLAGCDTVGDAATSAADATTGVVEGVASALDPTSWFGDDETDIASADSSVSTDTAAETTPDLANLPSRPATTPSAQSQAAAQSLAADGAQARYSADSLRAGTEASAPPPGAADIAPSAQMAMAAPPSDAPPTADMAPPSAEPAAPPSAARPAPAPVASAAPPPSALTQGTAAVPVPGGAQMAAAMPTPASAAAPATRPPGAQPAVPAVPANTPMRGAATGTQYASDAQLGFKPSEAPPLDASISQWVSQPVVARYRQTASGAGIAPVRLAAVPPKGGVGGPEAMSGSVTANLDAVSAPGAAIAAMNGGMTPAAVIYFPGDGTSISAAARTQIRNAVSQYKAQGGTGSIKVVGHASSRTANMPVERHLETIFKKSQDRANAVAQELIRQGVPAGKVLIDAVGDSQPVYYESMPQGEEGNRRAEIFLQG